jgi:hypothetical protein
MYSKMETAERAKKLEQLAFQLEVLEGILDGPYMAGTEMSTADSTIFPTMVFMTFMLPK